MPVLPEPDTPRIIDVDKVRMVRQELFMHGSAEMSPDEVAQAIDDLYGLETMINQAEAKYKEAKVYMIQHHAFYGSFLCQLKVGWTLDTFLAATDGEWLVMNPKNICEITKEELLFLLAHEVMHIAHLHAYRTKHREHMVFNIAADYAINDILRAEGDFSMHESGCWSEEFRNMSPEAIYTILYERLKKQQQEQDGEGDGSGQDGAEGEGEGKSNEEGSGKKRCGTCGTKNKGTASKCVACGEEFPPNEDTITAPGTVTGEELRVLGVDLDDPLLGDLKKPPPDLDAAELAEREFRAKQMAMEAAFHARAMGHDLKVARKIIDQAKKKDSWQLSLQSFVEAAIDKDDYTWSRPRRRYVPFEMYLPDMGGTKPPKAVAIVVDVSGSIDDNLLKLFLAELTSLIQANPNVTYHMYAVDTRIKDYRTVGIEDLPIKWNVEAGGGTNFCPAFEDLAEKQIPVSGLVYFTDMYCYDYPSKEPPFPTLWMNYGAIDYNEDGSMNESQQYSYSEYQPPFGTVTNMRL